MYHPEVKPLFEGQLRSTRRRMDTGDSIHTSEIRRIYDNSDMIRFISTRYTHKRKGWSTTKRQSMALPEISSNTSTRDEQTRQQRNNSVCLERQTKEFGRATVQLHRTHRPAKPRPADTFIFKSTDKCIEQCLHQQGWQEIRSRNHPNFSLKWVSEPSNMDFMYLRPSQRFNHIRNLEEVINLHSKKNTQHWCRVFHYNRDCDAFAREYERQAMLNLLKKHISYFQQKEVQVEQRSVSIVDVLKHSKFAQSKRPGFLVNVPILVQACLYYQQLLDAMGLSSAHAELDIHLDSKSMQNMVAYSRINPPYEQYEEFKHSYIQDEKTSSKDGNGRLCFSRGYHRYNSGESMVTPSQQLVLLLRRYDRLFREHCSDYLASGIDNQWVLIDKSQAHRTWKEPLTTSKKQSQEIYLQKHIEKPLSLSPNKLMLFRSYVVVSCDEPSFQLFLLDKHFCVEVPCLTENSLAMAGQQKDLPTKLINLQEAEQRLKLSHLHETFSSQMARIVPESIALKELQKKKGCFAVLTIHSVVDEWLKVWLQDITEGCDLFQLPPGIDSSVCMNIASDLLAVLLSKFQEGRYWLRLSTTREEPLKKQELPAVENSMIKHVQTKLKAELILRRIAQKAVLSRLCSCLQKCSEWKQHRHSSHQVDIKLGLSLLSRIIRRRLRRLFVVAAAH